MFACMQSKSAVHSIVLALLFYSLQHPRQPAVMVMRLHVSLFSEGIATAHSSRGATGSLCEQSTNRKILSIQNNKKKFLPDIPFKQVTTADVSV